MNIGEPIASVVSLLEGSGYRALEQPINIGGIPFQFGATLVGATSLDLIVIVDTVVDHDDDGLRRRVEGLSRTLDVAGSRRPLTIILVGPPPGPAVFNALARVCRVLVVGSKADDELGDALAVLLPLELSTERDGPSESWANIREQLLAAHPGVDTVELFDASTRGGNAVRDALRQLLVAPFESWNVP